jgi:hypothetical protein
VIKEIIPRSGILLVKSPGNRGENMCKALKFAIGGPLLGFGASWLLKVVLVSYGYDDGTTRVGFLGFTLIICFIIVGGLLVLQSLKRE